MGQTLSSQEHGDAAAGDVERLAREYRAPLLRYFQRHGVGRATAEDLAQEAFYRLARRDPGSQIENAQAYLFRIAASVLADHGRRAVAHRAAFHVPLETTMGGSDVLTPVRILEGKEALNRVQAALAELRPKAREVFLLSRLDGLTYSQIAVRLGVSPSAVEKHMMKAISHLHARLGGL